ncbi:hypothetical protein HDU84_009514 [Entophlyctis sp. JEL0112]|nr:hypothetical protein HDU84_009514 [Entophlyctis sp. JEL0112]
MKKLQHPNIVRLFEVLHDPSEEIIYMVYELVEKGTVIDVSMSKSTDPLSENVARRYFRQLILGIEYLHEHDIAHRDIKPDNLLISKDDVLKIVDFGVSEIFSSQGNDKSKKTEGSPAFFPPELCMPNHGEISARAVDVWAIGVTLFCMVRGTLPFKGDSIVDLYDQIKCSTPPIELMSSNLADLIGRLLDKSPDTRITMDEIRDHPWITNNSADPLIPTKAQNCHKMVTEITKEEIATAVSVFNPVWTVMRAIQKFKTKLTPSSSPAASRENLSILAAAPSGSDVVKSSDSLQVPDRIV